jgi:hypothetical protein
MILLCFQIKSDPISDMKGTSKLKQLCLGGVGKVQNHVMLIVDAWLRTPDSVQASQHEHGERTR